MKIITTLPVLCSIFLLMAGCKKSSNAPAPPNEPTSSTQWTFNNTTFKGQPAQWFYDSTGELGALDSQDGTGANELGVEFLVPDPSARPAPGKYYFVNPNGTSYPSGIPPTQFCILEAGPLTNVVSSIGGTPADTAIVTFDAANKMIVYFSNITVTGGIKVSGTLVE